MVAPLSPRPSSPLPLTAAPGPAPAAGQPSLLRRRGNDADGPAAPMPPLALSAAAPLGLREGGCGCCSCCERDVVRGPPEGLRDGILEGGMTSRSSAGSARPVICLASVRTHWVTKSD